MFRILVAESDPTLARSITRELVKNGYDAMLAVSSEDALELTVCEYFDAIIADTTLKTMDGYTLVRSLRASGVSMPIMLISDNSGYDFLHLGFISGADDFMVKPLNTSEMILRTKAMLRRMQMVRERTISVGATLIDYSAMTVCYGGKSVVLPLKEFLLLYKLCASPGRIITRQQIMDDIWGYESGADMHTVDVHISRLRSHLNDNTDIRIKTVRGIGYKLERG